MWKRKEIQILSRKELVILWVEYNGALMEISQPELICDKDK